MVYRRRQIWVCSELDEAIKKIQKNISDSQDKSISYIQAQVICANMLAPRIIITPQPARGRRKYHIEDILNVGL